MGLDVPLVLFSVVVDTNGLLVFCVVVDSETENCADVLNDVEGDTLCDDFRVPLTVELTVDVVCNDVSGELVRVNNDELVPPPPFLCIEADEHTDVLGDKVICDDEESKDVAENDTKSDVDADSEETVDGVEKAVIEICITDGVLIEDIDDDVDSERGGEEDGLIDSDCESITDCDGVGEPCSDIESVKLDEVKADIEASPPPLSGDALVVNEATDALALRDIRALNEALRDSCADDDSRELAVSDVDTLPLPLVDMLRDGLFEDD